ncbi:Hypothetical predicted protein, partial [Mytilus galloprovincialis]
MDTDEDYEMNSSGEDFNHSQHFTEEDLLDSLFLTCDVKKAGVVPVSNLIEYLKFTSSAISERDDDLQNLEHLFNEGGDEVNIETYRQVMYHWIDAIRKRSENESSQEDALERRSNGPICLSKDISILRGHNMDTSIVDTFGTDFDPVDQQNTIEDLQHQNRKLTEENTKLRQQIDVQDDIVTTNQNEIDILHKKVKSLQQTADSKHETIAENEELKSTISKLQEKKKDLSTKITQIDKEKLSYENQCSDLQLKLIELTSQLESLTSQKELLNKEAAEYKHELVHARDLKSLQEIQLNERYLEVNSLKKQLEDLCVQLKEYKKENDEVKFELMQSKQDIISFSHMPSESGDGVEEMISKAAGSFVCSTPMRHSQSLCMELKGMLGSDKHLPSPLCPKEYHKEYRMDLLPVFDEEDEDCNPEDDTDNQLAADISSFTEKFKHKQSELLAEIDSYFRQDNEENQTSKESLHSSLQKELTEMTEQMASLAIAKDTVDKRVNHLSKSMKKIRDENAMLRRLQHDSRSMLVECDRDLQNVVDRRLLVLKENLDEEKNLVKRLKKELEEKSKTILKLESLQTLGLDKTEKLKEEINALKRLVILFNNTCPFSKLQMPEEIRKMSLEDRQLYTEIIRTGTEIRYFVRIQIIGENGVGKTCLLRRLLKEDIDDVTSTDGVDIVVRKCKIRLRDGKWIIGQVDDDRKQMKERIERALIKDNIQGRSNISEDYNVAKGLTYAKVKSKADSKENELKYTRVLHESTNRSYEFDADSLPREFISSKESSRIASPSNVHHYIHEASKQNKTSQITDIMKQQIIEKMNSILSDVRKHKKVDDELADCALWDFAGERDYYATHQTFLTKHAIYVIVTDVSKDIKDIIPDTEYDSVGEYIDFWFDSIHCFCAKYSQDRLDPPVILVCTGADKVNIQQRRSDFRRQFNRALANEEKRKHLREIYFLSNTESPEETFDGLRNIISRISKERQYFIEHLPLRWISLENALDVLREFQINVISLGDVMQLASQNTINEKKEVILFLNYQHSIGNMIFFEDTDECIILNPKWLVKAFRCLISDKIDHNLKITAEWTDLEESGRLSEKLIRKLFEKESNLEFVKYQSHILAVLEKFNIINRPSILDINNKKNLLHAYYMPSMIVDSPPFQQIRKDFGIDNTQCLASPWLCLEFNFLPIAYFSHILLSFLRHYTVCEETNHRKLALYHGKGVFYLDNSKYTKMIVCFSKNAISIQIWSWVKLGAGIFSSVKEHLCSMITCLNDKLKQHVSYYVKVKCKTGSYEVLSGRLTFDEVKERQSYFCEEHKQIHQTNHLFETWFEDIYSNPEDKEFKLPICEK